MLKINYLTEKNALNKNAKNALFLVELEGQKKTVNKNVKRQKLNLSLVLDVSGSMSEYIGRFPMSDGVLLNNSLRGGLIQNHLGHFGHFEQQPFATSLTKMELVKKAAIKAVESLKDGDYISLVIFNSDAKVVKEACKVTGESKLEIIRQIGGLRAGGGTNVHTGWVNGATEVVKNIKDKFINRVMVLTDGETMSGVTGTPEIAADVAALYKTGVSTSTFGVGDRFNEKLLEAMSESGGGNFYYIKDEKEFDQMFLEEFTGMANVAATEIKFTLALKDGFTLAEQMNCFEAKDGVYNLSNVLSGSKLSLLFKLDTNYSAKDGDTVEVGEIHIEYKDENGNKVEQTVAIDSTLLSGKKWEKLDFNQEVKIQETLLIIAKNKIEASTQILAGNMGAARGILESASGMLRSSGLEDSRISASMTTLNSTLAESTTMSADQFNKSIHYQAYKTRTGKDIE